MAIELTVFTKDHGLLTKRISLNKDGKLISDGSACFMVHGTAQRVERGSMKSIAELIGSLESNQAIATGTLHADLPDQVRIATKDRVEELNGSARPDLIARTAANIVFIADHESLVLFDFDSKGMPATVAAKVTAHGGFWNALVSVLPELADTARVMRSSTSAGLWRSDTGKPVAGSDGVHVYVAIADGADSGRFLRVMHERCWLAGLGWMMVGGGGQMLERSIVDRMVGAPERLVFEGAPIVEPPLYQDLALRRPQSVGGEVLQTSVVCPPLTIVERSRLAAIKAKAAHQLAPELHKARGAYIERRAKALIKRTGCSEQDARKSVERQCNGVLRPGIVLVFDNPELANKTVGDVLADPDRFAGETLADPVEGVGYGRSVAKILRRDDGTLFIHSFAHGRAIYELKYDAATVRQTLTRARREDVLTQFISMAVDADLDAIELEQLRQQTKQLSDANFSTINAALKAARLEQAERQNRERLRQQQAERQDPRPQIPVPAEDAPFNDVVVLLNEILSDYATPPMRNIDGELTEVMLSRTPHAHAFTMYQETDTTLPPPEQLILRRMTEIRAAEMLERYVDFVKEDKQGNLRSVHLPKRFVEHYLIQDDTTLPIVATISVAPIVLPDGGLLAPDGLDRDTGILFRIPPELLDLIPQPDKCTPAAVKEAMRFLCDEWLVDVMTDEVGKCVVLALALTMLERSVLPERPAFFITAGQPLAGKTTLIFMLIRALLGIKPAASSWSDSEEERRKTLMAQLMSGVSYILWDNINRGLQISCPHIERACTSEFYVDRRLGVSEMVRASAAVVQIFTGNNINARGDLVSRSLEIRLQSDRANPANREYQHPKIENWTMAHRGEILAAMYTILLANPELDQPIDAAAKTRFKTWWRMVGAALEHAADCAGFAAIDFQTLFIEQEDDDAASLADVLEILLEMLPGVFQAADITDSVNTTNHSHQHATLRQFLFPGVPDHYVVTPRGVGKKLVKYVDQIIESGDRKVVLRKHRIVGGSHNGVMEYWVEEQGQKHDQPA